MYNFLLFKKISNFSDRSTPTLNSTNFSVIVSNLDGLTDIYQTRYAFNNLYTVTIFNLGDDPEDATIDTDTMKNYIQFNSQAVSFNGEALNLERNAVTKKFQVGGVSGDSYKWSDVLSITYRESELWQVKKYHEEWLDLFYNKETDKYRSHTNPSTEGLYRNITITLPNQLTINFYNCIPGNSGNFSFTWGESSSIVTHAINYYPEYWEWGNSTGN